ncbi:glycosyltransferase family 2 protein [Occallatibacter riparius]|uniref:Glycosyltransferase family 2 protein n=1 Tax=Occallatibacter riparius TaxID=1002689 RepID=A0A9J7BML1_9BACT|nr:glycosyltransferase family 2 protein [Occallatibacter riparius]UWZ83923.1 glycosyltransferase family 2 protein [Occallatibacter riparius]
MVSVVVPIYNEEELVVRFHEAVASALKGVVDDWEVVYVNDGSTDSSLELLKGLQAVDSHVVVVELSRNWGHMGAISAGLQTARGRAIILMDGDFQDPPEVLPQLIDAWREGAEVVVGVRRSRQESRKLLAFLFPMFYRVLGALADYPIPLNAGIFSLMDRKALDSVLAMREKNRYLPGLRAWVGYKNSIVYYDRNDRLGGEGKLSFISRIKYAMDAITSFSYKPLRLSFALMGFSTTVAMMLALCMALPTSAIVTAGFGVAASVFFMGGLLLLSIGILGEYIGRVYDEVRNRPLSLISQVHRSQVKIASQVGMIALPGGYGTVGEAYAISAAEAYGNDVTRAA